MYKPSLISAGPGYQHLAKLSDRHALPFGTGHSLADAKPVRLGDTTKADGRWRMFASLIAGPSARSSRMRALCGFLPTPPSLRSVDTPAKADIDSVIRCPGCVQQKHRELELEAMPQFLLPSKGRYGLRDYEKCSVRT